MALKERLRKEAAWQRSFYGNRGVASLLEEASTELERLERESRFPSPSRTSPDPGEFKSGCPVCGVGADGKPMAYACSRSDCPTRIT